MPDLRLQAIVKAVGTSAVLVVALVILYLVATLKFDPWWLQLVFGLGPIALIVAGVVWMLSGGEHGASVEIRDGQRYFAATNVNVLARALAQSALDVFGRNPLPMPKGVIAGGSPADPANIIEVAAELPPDVDVEEKHVEPPEGAGQLP